MSELSDYFEKQLARAPSAAFDAGISFCVGLIADALLGRGGEPAYVAEFRRRFDEISTELDRINKSIEVLGILIIEERFKEKREQLVSKLRSYLELSAEWRRTNVDRGLAQNYFRDLQDARNDLFANSYGYFAILGFTLVSELRLAEAAGFKKDTLLAVCDAYIGYFERAKDPAIIGSVADKLAKVSSVEAPEFKGRYPDNPAVVEAYFTGESNNSVLGNSWDLTSAHFGMTGSLDRPALPAFTLAGPYQGDFFGNPVQRDGPEWNSREHISMEEVESRAGRALAVWNAQWDPYQSLFKFKIPALESAMRNLDALILVANRVREAVDASGLGIVQNYEIESGDLSAQGGQTPE